MLLVLTDEKTKFQPPATFFFMFFLFNLFHYCAKSTIFALLKNAKNISSFIKKKCYPHITKSFLTS